MITKEDLKFGEVICSKCNGECALDVPNNPDLLQQCPKCDGHGKLDWIQNVMGKRHIFNDFFSSDPDGAVDLYYAGNKIIETTADGGIIYHGQKYGPCGGT